MMDETRSCEICGIHLRPVQIGQGLRGALDKEMVLIFHREDQPDAAPLESCDRALGAAAARHHVGEPALPIVEEIGAQHAQQQAPVQGWMGGGTNVTAGLSSSCLPLTAT